jgi:hypothetical protein
MSPIDVPLLPFWIGAGLVAGLLSHLVRQYHRRHVPLSVALRGLAVLLVCRGGWLVGWILVTGARL